MYTIANKSNIADQSTAFAPADSYIQNDL